LQEATALLAEALNEDASATLVRRDLGMALFVSGRAADAAVHLALAQKAEPTAEGARMLGDAHDAAGNAGARDVALAEERALMARAQRERVARLIGSPPAP
jgi:predicted Zn-dependent protease